MYEERYKKVVLLLCLGGLIVLTMLGVVATTFLPEWGSALANHLTAAYLPLYYAGARLWFHLYYGTEL